MGYKYPKEPLISAPEPHRCQRYEGKVCIVTASTLGIGLAIATRFAEEGGKVVISSRKKDQVEKVVNDLQRRGFEVVGTVCHQAKKSDRKALIDMAVKKWGRVDVLVLNAAVQPAAAVGKTIEVPDEMFDKIFEVNVKSYWQFVKEAYAHMTKPGSNILMVSSQGGLNPSAPLGLYAISKTTLLGLTKLLASELGPKGIRVNCLAPGLVRTRFSEMLWKGEEASALKATEAVTFIGRAGEPWEQAGVVAFLCSNDAMYVNGETVLANGGGRNSRL